jgi:hypothetical protein
MFFLLIVLFLKCPDVNRSSTRCRTSAVEAKPSVVHFSLWRGPGISFHEQPPVMEMIPVQFRAGVIVAMPPPSSARREEEIMAPESPGGGGVGSPTWSQLEEDEGA